MMIKTTRSPTKSTRTASQNDKQINIDNVLLKQLNVKDQQIANLQKALDQQQQLQLATVAKNRELKKHSEIK